jgi:hypothetical protein
MRSGGRTSGEAPMTWTRTRRGGRFAALRPFGRGSGHWAKLRGALPQQPPPCAVTVRQAFLSITDRALEVPGPFLLVPAIVILA